MFKRYALIVVILGLVISAAGCGYTTRSALSSRYSSIYVDSFTNQIKITEEQSDTRMYRGYRHGLETEVTRAVIDRFLLDGNLKVAGQADASLILKGDLIDFRKEPLRYDANDTVEEYRIIITVNMELEDVREGKVLWRERHFAGESSYRTSGSLAKGEDAAIKDAVSDLARRIVERSIEGW
jgi:hypothetical protein